MEQNSKNTEMSTFIEVQSYGDFDIKYTNCIMVHYDKLDKIEILNEFYKLQGITSNEGLDYKILSTITEDFICFLELKGFKKLQTQSVYFCD